MINELLKAITDKIADCGFDVDFYLEEAPVGKHFPYVTFMLVDNVPEGAWPDVEMEISRIQFSVFAQGDETQSGANEAGVIVAAIKACFDWACFDIDGHYCLCCQREIETGFKIEKVWQKNIDYIVRLQKQV